MYKILKKEILGPAVKLMEIDAPRIAQKTLPGQFTILRVCEGGERIPLTVADYDRQKGSVTIVFQEVGKTTRLLGELNEGDYILDFAGPLGVASHLSGYKKACVVGGGLGCAIAYPQAKALHEMGAEVDIIAGFRSSDLIFFEKEMAACCDNLILCTDDGSNGNKGLVTEFLKKRIDEGAEYDLVVAIGPPIMMKFVAATTKPYGINTVVSLNPIMIDGTGMCGGCRVRVGGETKFACVDGPDFDGHLVDFDELMRRGGMYRDIEQKKLNEHICRLEGVADNA